MYAIIVPLIALGLYWGYVSGNADLTVGAAIAAIVAGVIGLVFALVAAYNHKLARSAGIAMGGATVALMVFVAGCFAFIAWFAVRFVSDKSPDTASMQTEVIFTLVGVIVSGFITFFVGKPFFPAGPTVAKWVLCGRLQSKYPSMPAGTAQAIEAYKAVRDSCAGKPTDCWNMRQRIALFSKVNNAIAAGACDEGRDWTPATPPRPWANPDATGADSNPPRDSTLTADADYTPPDEGQP